MAADVRHIGAKIKKTVKDSYIGWIFVAPVILGIFIFTFYPMLQSLLYSFQRYNPQEKYYIGFENYKNIFTVYKEETFMMFGNTFLYAVITIPVNLALSYFVALLVNQKIKGVTVFRVLYYLPVVIPGVISGIIWAQMFRDDMHGVFNTIFGLMGRENPYTFFSEDETALSSAIIMNFWSLGGGMILWLSSFKNIPTALYEAAKIDGANPAHRFLRITIPLSTPMIFYNLVTGVIGALQNNGPMVYAREMAREGHPLYFAAVAIYDQGLASRNYGYASALAWVLFLVIAVLTAFTFGSSKWVYTGDN